MTTEPEAEKLPYNIGWDGMPKNLRGIVESVPSLKGKYNSEVLTMLHVIGTKNSYGKTPQGANILIAMDDRKVWMPTAMMLNAQCHGCEWVAFISDAFTKEYRGPDAAQSRKGLRTGELEDMYNSGDLTVREAMITVLRDDAGNEWHCQWHYSAGDDDECVWEEPHWYAVTEGGMQGDGFVSDVLQVLLGHRQVTPGELVSVLANLQNSGIEVAEVEIPTHDDEVAIHDD